MLSFANMPEIVVQEKIEFNPFVNIVKKLARNKHGGFNSDSFLNKQKNGEMKIIRHLSADTFDISFENMNNGQVKTKAESYYPYVNFAVNKKQSMTYDTAYITSNVVKEPEFTIIHRDVFADSKFSDISKITLGYSIGDIKTAEPTFDQTLSRITTRPFLFPTRKNVGATFDQVIHLKTIKTISIKKDSKYETSSSGGDVKITDRKRIGFTTDITYNNIYIVPIKPTRFSENKHLFNIYMNNGDGSSIVGDNRLISKKMKSSSFGSVGIETEVVEDTSTEYIDGDNKKVKQVARIDLIRRSHYDYDKKKTVLGNSWDSVDGEIIPYSLKGEYSRQLDISLNNSFKGMKLSFSENIATPYLDPNEGEVQLKIDNNAKPTAIIREALKHKMHKIDNDMIRQIKKNDFSLIGLERL